MKKFLLLLSLTGSMYGSGAAQHTQSASMFRKIDQIAAAVAAVVVDGVEIVGRVALRYTPRVVVAGLSQCGISNRSQICKTILILMAMRKLGFLNLGAYAIKNGALNYGLKATRLGLQAGWFVTRHGVPMLFNALSGEPIFFKNL